MDVIFWISAALVSFVILVLGMRRARRSGNSSSAIDEGTRPNITKAPNSSSLEDFGEDLLAQELRRLRSQQSFYDSLIDWFGQRFTFWQSNVLVSAWRRFFTNVTGAASDQDEFTRRTSSRSNIPLEIDKEASKLKADIAEEELRAATARQQQDDLGKESEPPKKDKIKERLEREEQRAEERKALKNFFNEQKAKAIKSIVGDKEEKVWTEEEREAVEQERNYWDAKINRLREN